MADEEVWKEIPGFEDCYEASTHGNVRSLDRLSVSYGDRICGRTGRTLSPCSSGKYNAVTLSKNGEITCHNVHRLVALAHLPNPDNLPEVDHIDRNKRNNHISNLRWASKSTNQRNKDMPKHNTSGHMYIRFMKEINRWRVQIKWLNVQKRTKTLEEAIKIRDEALAANAIV